MDTIFHISMTVIFILLVAVFIKAVYDLIKGLINDIEPDEPDNSLHSIESLLKESGIKTDPDELDIKAFAVLIKEHHGSTMGTVVRKDVFYKVIQSSLNENEED